MPSRSQEVGDQDDECALNSHLGGFKLAHVSVDHEQDEGSTYRVYLIHDGLESCKTSGQEHAPKSQSWISVVPHGKQVCRGIGAGDDDLLVCVDEGLVIVSKAFGCGDLDRAIVVLFIEGGFGQVVCPWSPLRGW